MLPYTFNFVADTVDFIAIVYGAKATRSTLSTFNKVDRVEFNFIASAYRLTWLEFAFLDLKLEYAKGAKMTKGGDWGRIPFFPAEIWGTS